MNPSLVSLLNAAIARRKNLDAVTNAMRLVNGVGDNLPGILVDRYNTHFVIQMFDPSVRPKVDEFRKLLMERFEVQYLVIKDRSANASSKPDDFLAKSLVGDNPKTIVEEYGVKFAVDLNDGLNAGLFLDMRANRITVGKLCADKKILNCFAYTCSFGTHARHYGAKEVFNVDISRKTLERGQANYALNGFAPAEGEFVRADAVKYLERAVKKENRFDVIILDPPSFARHEGKTFQVQRDLVKLMADAIVSLNPGGVLFVSTNYSGIGAKDLDKMLNLALKGRRANNVQHLGQDTDFVGSGQFKESHLVGLLVQLA